MYQMKSQSSWDIRRWQDEKDIYLNLTEQKALWTSSPLKVFGSTWWMLISRSIYTKPTTSLKSRTLLITRWHSYASANINNKLIEISTRYMSRGRLLFQSWWVLFELQYPINEMKHSYVPRALTRLYVLFAPHLCLLIVIPCQLHYLLSMPFPPSTSHKKT